MTITILSSREFNQDTSRAKKAASKGPVFITDRGKPNYVLLSIAEYQRITGDRVSIADALAMPGSVDIELEVPPRTSERMASIYPDVSAGYQCCFRNSQSPEAPGLS